MHYPIAKGIVLDYCTDPIPLRKVFNLNGYIAHGYSSHLSTARDGAGPVFLVSMSREFYATVSRGEQRFHMRMRQEHRIGRSCRHEMFDE